MCQQNITGRKIRIAIIRFWIKVLFALTSIPVQRLHQYHLMHWILYKWDVLNNTFSAQIGTIYCLKIHCSFYTNSKHLLFILCIFCSMVTASYHKSKQCFNATFISTHLKFIMFSNNKQFKRHAHESCLCLTTLTVFWISFFKFTDPCINFPLFIFISSRVISCFVRG